MPGTETIEQTTAAAVLQELTPGSLQPHPLNPRVDVGDITELADSIRAKGLMHPIVVVPAAAKGKYRIIAGHRRHAAAKHAGLKRVPCIVRTDLDDEADQLASMISENLERANLTVLEEAAAVQGLLDLGDSMTGAAARTGMSKRRISDRVKVAKMPDDLKAKVAAHTLSLDDALFVSKYSEFPEDAEYLDRNLGTANWQFAKQRVAEIAADRRKAEKWRSEIADCGLEIAPGYTEFRAWMETHGFTSASPEVRVPWADRPRDVTPGPAASVVYWLQDQQPQLYTFSDPPSELNEDGQSSANTDGGAHTAGGAAADDDEVAARRARRDAEDAARVQRKADLATAETVRAKALSDAIARGGSDAAAVLAMKLALRFEFDQYDGYENEQLQALVGIPPEKIRATVDDATSLQWLVLVFALMQNGVEVHRKFTSSPDYLTGNDLEWATLFEALGHEWSNVEREVLAAVRARVAAAAELDDPVDNDE